MRPFLNICGVALASSIVATYLWADSDNSDGNATSASSISPVKSLIVVEGRASVDAVSSGTRDAFARPGGGAVDVYRYSVPFQVTQASDSSLPKEIEVFVFTPVDETKRAHWSLPLKEPLVLILKPSNGNNAYEMVDPRQSWIVDEGEDAMPLNSLNKDQFMLDVAERYLKTVLEHPDFRPQYAAEPNKPNQTFDFRQNDPATINALLTIGKLSNGDSGAQAIVSQFINADGVTGETARKVLGSSGDFNALIQRLKDFDANKLSEADEFNFPYELGTAIKTCDFTPISWVQSTKQRLVEWQEVAGVK
jgi:hypothetical protein